jgi:hypothetical protein
MAEPFQHISGAAVKVLARLAAKKAVKAEIKASGKRALVSAGEIMARTNVYLANNPQLYEQAMATAWAIAAKDQQGRLNAALFDDYRRKPRKRRPVNQVATNRALKSLEFSIQLVRFSEARAY